jgi:glutaredoxin 3
MKKYLFLFVLLSVFLGRSAIADFYKWVDEKGETQITDFPPPQDKVAKDIEIHLSPAANITDTQKSDDSSKDKDAKKTNAVLYTRNNCPDCDKAREYLKSKNFAFTEYNMDTDKDAASKRKEIDDGEDVPFAFINKTRIFGFSESAYNTALKKEP